MKLTTGYKELVSKDGRPLPLELSPSDFKYLGKDVCIWPQAKLVNTENISVGHRSIIDDFVLILALGEEVRIGKFVHIGSFGSITGGGGFEMEDFSGFAAGVRVATTDEDYSGGTCLTNPSIPEGFRKVKKVKVVVKKHAIIGTNTVILPGIVIGEGCSVGANAVVTKDLPPWSLCVGAPARPIKKRPSETILQLEKELMQQYPQYQ